MSLKENPALFLHSSVLPYSTSSDSPSDKWALEAGCVTSVNNYLRLSGQCFWKRANSHMWCVLISVSSGSLRIPSERMNGQLLLQFEPDFWKVLETHLLSAPSFDWRECTVCRELPTGLVNKRPICYSEKGHVRHGARGRIGFIPHHYSDIHVWLHFIWLCPFPWRLGLCHKGQILTKRRQTFLWRLHRGQVLPTWDPSDVPSQFFITAYSSMLGQMGFVRRKVPSLLKSSQFTVGGHFNLQNPLSTLWLSNYKESKIRTSILIFKLRAPGICLGSHSWDWNPRLFFLVQPVYSHQKWWVLSQTTRSP